MYGCVNIIHSCTQSKFSLKQPEILGIPEQFAIYTSCCIYAMPYRLLSWSQRTWIFFLTLILPTLMKSIHWVNTTIPLIFKMTWQNSKIRLKYHKIPQYWPNSNLFKHLYSPCRIGRTILVHLLQMPAPTPVKVCCSSFPALLHHNQSVFHLIHLMIHKYIATMDFQALLHHWR